MADPPDRAPKLAIAPKAETPSTLERQVDAAFHKAIAKEPVPHALPAASDLTTRSAVSHLDDHTRAELEAENRRLIAALKRHLSINFDDPGNAGVPNAVFLAGWNGVRLKPPCR